MPIFLPTSYKTCSHVYSADGSGGYRVNDMRKQRKNKPTPSLPPQKMSSSKGQQLDFDELSDMDDIFGSSEIPSPSPTTAANGLNNQAMSTISLQNQGNQNTLPGMQDWQQPAGQTANFGLGPTPIRNDNFGPQVMSLPQGHATMSIQGPHGNQPLPSQGNTMQQQLYMIQGQQHQFMMQQPQLHQPPQQLPQHFMPQQLDPAPQQHFMMQQQQPYQSQQVTQPQLYNPQQQQLQRLQQQQYQQQQHHQSFF